MLHIEYLPIEEVKPYEKNPRTHSKEQIRRIAKSISEFGFKIPLVVDAENTIITGHGRYLAAKYLGIKELPVIRAKDLTPEQAKAFRIADNRLTLESDWDLDLLGEELYSIAEAGYDISLTMLDEKEINYFIQTALNDLDEEDFNPEKEWEGMPEYYSEDKTPLRQIIVNFEDEGAVKQFAQLTGARITDKTKSIWFPPKERVNRKDYAWVGVTDDEVEQGDEEI